MNLALAILLLFLQAIGFGRTLPWSMLPFDFGRILWFLLSVWVVIWVARPARLAKWLPDSNRILEYVQRRSVLIAFAALNLPYLAFSYFKFGVFGYQFPIVHIIVMAVTLPFLRKGRIEISFIFSLLFLVASLIHFPIHPDRSDMLAVIRQGLGFFGDGENPYQRYPMGNRENWLSYLPGTALFHWPAWRFGLDLRWNTFLFRAGWMVLVMILLRRMTRNQREPASTVVQYFALSPYLNFRHDLYFEGFLFLMASWFVFPRSRLLVLPMLVWTRQFAWVFAPFWLASEVLCKNRIRWKSVVEFIAGLSLVSLIFVQGLKGITTLQDIQRAVFWFQEVITRPLFAGDFGLTFAPLFFTLGISTLLQKIQATFLMGLFCGALLRWRKGLTVDWLQISAVAWVGFVILNPHFWLYFWTEVIFFLILLALKSNSPRELGRT